MQNKYVKLEIIRSKTCFKCLFYYLLFKKFPEKIISGAKIGLDIANAAFTDGEAAEINDPNATVAFATRIIVPQQIKKRIASLFKLHIQ